jgi:acyl-CoA reductase-like NAD-dependent aldehyde dehydrogenase
MKMRPGAPTGFLLCGKEWTDGETLEVRSPWDQGLVGRATIATRADARQAVNHATASMRRTRALPRWKRREILEDVAGALSRRSDLRNLSWLRPVSHCAWHIPRWIARC